MRLLNFLNENKNSIGIFTGRFQPMHKGHLSFIQAISKENIVGYVFVIAGAKSGADKTRNPISQQDRINLIKSVVPSNIKVLPAPNAYIPDLVNNLEIPTTNKIVIYAGADRSSEYSRFVNKLSDMGYIAEINTKDFNRAGVSASIVRELLRAGDNKEAQKYLPYSIKKLEKWF